MLTCNFSNVQHLPTKTQSTSTTTYSIFFLGSFIFFAIRDFKASNWKENNHFLHEDCVHLLAVNTNRSNANILVSSSGIFFPTCVDIDCTAGKLSQKLVIYFRVLRPFTRSDTESVLVVSGFCRRWINSSLWTHHATALIPPPNFLIWLLSACISPPGSKFLRTEREREKHNITLWEFKQRMDQERRKCLTTFTQTQIL